jgi:hypothetical protein
VTEIDLGGCRGVSRWHGSSVAEVDVHMTMAVVVVEHVDAWRACTRSM